MSFDLHNYIPRYTPRDRQLWRTMVYFCLNKFYHNVYTSTSATTDLLSYRIPKFSVNHSNNNLWPLRYIVYPCRPKRSIIQPIVISRYFRYSSSIFLICGQRPDQSIGNSDLNERQLRFKRETSDLEFRRHFVTHYWLTFKGCIPTLQVASQLRNKHFYFRAIDISSTC